MANPFGTSAMADGYATARPPVHARIWQRVLPHITARVRRALDVGCGAGLSTRVLLDCADQCIGMDRSESMVRHGAATAPGAHFLVGSAEALPFVAGSIDLISAAGSLNYVRLDSFFREAYRVLDANGMLVVYDFSPGRSFRQGSGLEDWFAEFEQRFPPPPGEGQFLDPGILGQLAGGFRLHSHEKVDAAVTLSPSFYIRYIMTETNVPFAVRNGIPR